MQSTVSLPVRWERDDEWVGVMLPDSRERERVRESSRPYQSKTAQREGVRMCVMLPVIERN